MTDLTDLTNFLFLTLTFECKLDKKGNMIDDELIGKFDQFQELLDSIMSPELMEALQKMEEAIQKMDLEPMLQATENFDYNLPSMSTWMI